MRTEAIFKEAEDIEKAGGSYIHLEHYPNQPTQVFLAGEARAIIIDIVTIMMKIASWGDGNFMHLLDYIKKLYKANKKEIDLAMKEKINDILTD